MPSLTAAAVRKHIRDGAPAPVYLLQGEDDVEKSALAAEFGDLVEEGLRAFNVERIHAGEATTGDKIAEGVLSLIDAVRTLPMMAPRRIVTVFQAENLLTPKRRRARSKISRRCSSRRSRRPHWCLLRRQSTSEPASSSC
jgi:hypothetical protein